MKKILVPTDFSDTANKAAEMAAAIAKKTDARIYLLHVINLLEYGGEDETAKQLFVMKLVKKKMDALIKKPFFKGVNVVVALQYDLVYDQIFRNAREHEIDLIVMGTHGSSGVKELFLGSNTQKIVRMAKCPVLTVKELPKSFEFDNMVFASDFSVEAQKAFWEISEFAALYKSKIHLLRVCTVSDFEHTDIAIERMEKFAKKAHLKDYTVNIYNSNFIESGIIGFSNSIGANLISIGTHGRTGFDLLISGSKTEKVVNHSNIPILSIQIPKK